MLPRATRWSVGSAVLLFAVVGQALANGTITGTLKAPSGSDLTDAKVAATSDKFAVVRGDVDSSTGAFSLDAGAGTYTVVAITKGLESSPVKSVVVTDGQTAKVGDITLKAATPLKIPKAATPISINDDIDSASFKDATEIDLNSGENVAVGDATTWGGPSTVSARVKMMYSEAALHIAAETTYLTPNVNIHVDDSMWNGNAFEIDIQTKPFDRVLTPDDYDADHNWQLVLGLGASSDWWLHGKIGAHPTLNGKDTGVTNYLKRVVDPNNKNKEKVRLDIPWGILLNGSGKGIATPKDGDLGAIDLAFDAANPTEPDKTAAERTFQITWSGQDSGWHDPSSLRPVVFSP
jgi:hypothetical protein